ncbi:protein GVQW3 [Trichonephila clavipes]|nr:protein GVQW3 [Trichonephila clavipes]
MAERTEQRICIKFCFNLGKSCAEPIEMLQKAFKDECMGKTQIKEWYGQFKNGRTSVDSDPHSGRPLTGTSSHNVERVRVTIEQDRRLTVRELEDEIRIPKSIVWRILTENLGMTRVSAKFIPKLLSDQQKNLRLEIAQDNLEMINSDENFLKKIITGEETWVYGYDPETKQQSSQWKFPSEPRPKKARQSNSKSMLIVFFDDEGIVHHEYAHTGQTINKEYYVEVLKRLVNAIRRKRPQLWESGDWLLHDDNAPAHTSNLVQQYL